MRSVILGLAATAAFLGSAANAVPLQTADIPTVNQPQHQFTQTEVLKLQEAVRSCKADAQKIWPDYDPDSAMLSAGPRFDAQTEYDVYCINQRTKIIGFHVFRYSEPR